jgi:putative N6-adenine-specific DNA methylase
VPLRLVATCALGLEEVLAGELAGLGAAEVRRETGAVTFAGGWAEVWRANWRLRTANRVLVELASWDAPDGDALAAGAEALAGARGRSWGGVAGSDLFHPDRTLAVRATTSRSQVRDVRWAALKVKDGLVDGQRKRWGRRATVARHDPDLPLRVWLHADRATLLLDTSGEPLDRRGYRLATAAASLRETLAAGVVLASGWDGRGPVVDPMCGAGTLLAEAGWVALGRPPGSLRRGWAFERLPGFDRRAFDAVRAEPLAAPGPDVALYGADLDPAALAAARGNLDRAGLGERAVLLEQDGLEFAPPPSPGLVVVNPPYGERLAAEPEMWRRLGDLLKRRYAGWQAAVLAGDPGRGKWIGLRPRRRLPVKNGPLDARILVFDLY